MAAADVRAGRAVIEVALKGNLSADAARIRSQLRMISDSIRGLTLLRIGSNIFSGFTAGLKGLLVPLKEAAKVETAIAGFTTFTRSAAKAVSVVKDLQRTASTTSLTFTGLENSVTLLTSYGLHINKAVELSKRLGEAARGQDDRFARLSLALAQTNAAGRLFATEARQFSEAGFGVLQVISERTGQSFGKLLELMHDGKISAKDVNDAFILATSKVGNYTGQFYKFLETQANTLAGSFSNLKDLFEQTLAAIGTPLLSTATAFAKFGQQVLITIKGIVEANPGLVKAFALTAIGATALGGSLVVLGGTLATLSGGYLLIKAGLGELIPSFRKVATAAAAPAITIEAVTDTATTMSAGIALAAQQSSASLAGMAGSMRTAQKSGSGAFAAISSAATAAANKVETSVAKILVNAAKLDAGLTAGISKLGVSLQATVAPATSLTTALSALATQIATTGVAVTALAAPVAALETSFGALSTQVAASTLVVKTNVKSMATDIKASMAASAKQITAFGTAMGKVASKTSKKAAANVVANTADQIVEVKQTKQLKGKAGTVAKEVATGMGVAAGASVAKIADQVAEATGKAVKKTKKTGKLSLQEMFSEPIKTLDLAKLASAYEKGETAQFLALVKSVNNPTRNKEAIKSVDELVDGTLAHLKTLAPRSEKELGEFDKLIASLGGGAVKETQRTFKDLDEMMQVVALTMVANIPDAASEVIHSLDKLADKAYEATGFVKELDSVLGKKATGGPVDLALLTQQASVSSSFAAASTAAANPLYSGISPETKKLGTTGRVGGILTQIRPNTFADDLLAQAADSIDSKNSPAQKYGASILEGVVAGMSAGAPATAKKLADVMDDVIDPVDLLKIIDQNFNAALTDVLGGGGAGAVPIAAPPIAGKHTGFAADVLALAGGGALGSALDDVLGTGKGPASQIASAVPLPNANITAYADKVSELHVAPDSHTGSKHAGFADDLLAGATGAADKLDLDNAAVAAAIAAQERDAFKDPEKKKKPKISSKAGKISPKSSFANDLLVGAGANLLDGRDSKRIKPNSRTKKGFAGRAMQAIGGTVANVASFAAPVTGPIVSSFASVGKSVGGLLSKLPAVGPLIAAAFSGIGPILATTAAITAVAAGVAYLLKRAGLLAPALKMITSTVKQFGDIFKKTFGGIADALSAGEYVLAARILWAGVKVAFFTGLKNVTSLIPKLFENGFSIAYKLGEAFIQTLADLFKALPKLIMAYVSGQQSIATIIKDILIGNFAGGEIDRQLTKNETELTALTSQAASKKDAFDKKKAAEAAADAKKGKPEVEPITEAQLAKSELEHRVKKGELDASVLSPNSALSKANEGDAVKINEAIKGANQDADERIRSLQIEVIGLTQGAHAAKDLTDAEAGVTKARRQSIASLEAQKKVLEARQNSKIDLTEILRGEAAANRLRLAQEGLNDAQIEEITTLDALKIATQERQDLFTEIAGLQDKLAGDTNGDMLKRVELERQGLNDEQIDEIILLRKRRDEIKELVEVQEKLREDAKALTEEFGRNPFQKMKDEIARIKEMQAQGLITPDVAKKAIDAEKAKLAPTIQPQKAITGRGADALALFRGRGTRVDEATKLSREQVRLQTKLLKEAEKQSRKEQFKITRGNF